MSIIVRRRLPRPRAGLRVLQTGHAPANGEDAIVAVPKMPSSLINEWAERIVVALLDQQAWFRHALAHGEIQILTGLNDLQVSRGCWHGRLHGLLNFAQNSGQVRYTLTPLGVAIARRLKAAPHDTVTPPLPSDSAVVVSES